MSERWILPSEETDQLPDLASSGDGRVIAQALLMVADELSLLRQMMSDQ